MESLDFADRQRSYQLFDLQGRLMRQNAIYQNETQINLSYLSSSTYLLLVYSDNQMTKSFKIIKIKTTKNETDIYPLLLVTVTLSSFAQAPEKMSYQAIMRRQDGNLVKNSNVSLKIIVRKGAANGSAVYQETHNVVSNSNGLVSLEIEQEQLH
jgi:hypothetical protein